MAFVKLRNRYFTGFIKTSFLNSRVRSNENVPERRESMVALLVDVVSPLFEVWKGSRLIKLLSIKGCKEYLCLWSALSLGCANRQ